MLISMAMTCPVSLKTMATGVLVIWLTIYGKMPTDVKQYASLDPIKQNYKDSKSRLK